MLVDKPERHREAAQKISAAFSKDAPLAPKLAVLPQQPGDLCGQIRRRRGLRLLCGAPRRFRRLYSELRHPSIKNRLVLHLPGCRTGGPVNVGNPVKSLLLERSRKYAALRVHCTPLHLTGSSMGVHGNEGRITPRSSFVRVAVDPHGRGV